MYAKPHIRELAPYIPGFQPAADQQVIKLNSNENPYPPSPQVQKALQTFDYSLLRRYPNATAEYVREELASIYNVEPSQVFCGNGSDEIIALLFRAFLPEESTIVLPYPTYSLYKTAARIHRVHPEFVATSADFRVDIEALLAVPSDAIILVNPNAPTGLLLPVESVAELARRYKGLLIIDEAYIDFADGAATALPLIHEHPNVIVIRTLSKSYSLCGIRFGYAFANAELIQSLDKCKDSYNVSMLTQTIAAAALRDQSYLAATIQRLKESRRELIGQLRSLGYSAPDSQANFVLCTPPASRGLTARQITEKLAEQHVYVRYFDSPLLEDKLRISIGTEEENERLFQLLRTM
ncbi:histidinol-phosphate transaminase [Paenibacillus lutrae]|uniref:Histidinol-phosphate aminotransferase n=1 Tax=Paenibacillus lutrae TaxID=2078573 RepID=A0A7X3FJL0_9BACL|nr:histidinol-phosphate transaminase [Paenibacillus lutrae]